MEINTGGLQEPKYTKLQQTHTKTHYNENDQNTE